MQSHPIASESHAGWNYFGIHQGYGVCRAGCHQTPYRQLFFFERHLVAVVTSSVQPVPVDIYAAPAVATGSAILVT